ncbi:putative C-S lyase [Marinomonas agarivorans]|nr:putative C-S lyase [Marinomonas agarivorans]
MGKLDNDIIESVPRQSTNSTKWDKYHDDILPMWVADMDFKSPTPIMDALHHRVNHGVFGYTDASQALQQAIIQNALTRYQWSISGNEISYLPGLVCALHLCVRTLTENGDGVVVPGPVYQNINKPVVDSGRQLHTVPMVLIDNRWVPDMDAFEQACAQANSKLILLCNPHNPGGTVFTRQELLAMHTLAEKYNLFVVSDEIHCDLLLDEGLQHIPFASLNDDAAARTITLMAPSKTYNIAGLGLAYAIIKGNTLRTKFNKAKSGLLPAPNLLAMAATQAAYSQCQTWHDALIKYLRKNRELIHTRLADTQCKMAKLEATYLAWIDVSHLNLEDTEAYFLAQKVAISPGKQFGNSQFIRLNFGCSHQLLEQALVRLLPAL